MRPYRPLLAVLALVACSEDPQPQPDAAADAAPDAVVEDRAPTPDQVSADVVDAPTADHGPDVVDAPDVAVDVPADRGPDVVDAPDVAVDAQADVAVDAAADAPDVAIDAADVVDVPTDVRICDEGARQCNGRVLELCQGNRWIPEPNCAAIRPDFTTCYMNTCFILCRTATCVANGGGVGHEGVCRTDADCAENGVGLPIGPDGGSVQVGEGRCEGGYCAVRYARSVCPAADAGLSCYDIMPIIRPLGYPDNRGCTSSNASRGQCGGIGRPACTQDLDCPRTHRCGYWDFASSDGYCVPR